MTMQDIATLLTLAQSAQRSGSPDAPARQRAYETARRDQARRRAHEAWLDRQSAARSAAEMALLAAEAAVYQDIPAGICSRRRAEHLMGAAAVAGGAIYVACPSVGLGEGIPCVGTVGGEPVADVRPLTIAQIRDALVATARIWASDPVLMDAMGEEIDDIIRVLAHMRRYEEAAA